MCIIIFVLWLKYENSKSSRADQSASKKYWTLEHQANLTRKKDISTLDYIKIPLAQLPFFENADEALMGFQNCIRDLSSQKILNLTGKTNTELKLNYGAVNLDLLSEYDQNFTLLARTLSQWASCLYEQGKKKEAAAVLEFGINCKSDVRNNYTLLAQIYLEQNQPEKIDQLITAASELTTLMKDSIVSSLSDIKKRNY